MLVPDRLRELWGGVDRGETTTEAVMEEQERLLDGYRAEWTRALLEGAETDLRAGMLRELALYSHAEPEEMERRCTAALATLRDEWQRDVDPERRSSIERFYESPTTIYELVDWHSLRYDNGPLAYVLALEVARESRVKTCLDFGSGVGSGALLFASAGIAVTLGDISTTLLDFCRWRFERRRLPATFVDMKTTTLPETAFDMILAMDVFEHLADPVETVESLWRSLKPGGLLFARIHAEEDADRPHHIVRDFEPTFARMRALNLVEIWRDGWLWGHQLFQKSPT
jgi:2-polyprenyl-3-methyl-5-hydroxy-6-metoxy-1,4-benzoquinol methylase